MKRLLMTVTSVLCLAALPVQAEDRSEAAREPVILINAFQVPPGKEDEAVRFWEKAAAFMRKQPGYISTALHRSVLPDARFKLINVARWESAEAFKAASRALRTRSGIKPLEGLVPNPSLYAIIRSD